MPEISVIVPVYNTEKYLPRCLDSLLSQTYRDFEVILIDDGSTDRSPTLCDACAAKDSRFSVIHQDNRGQAAARNRGIDIAMSGESKYLCFVDSDDWVLPEYLEALRNFIGEKKICSSLFSENGTGEAENFSCRVVGAEEYYCRGDRLPFVLWGKLFDKSLFASLRIPDVRINEDTFFVYRVLFRAENIAVVFAPLYCYFQNPDGLTASARSSNSTVELDAMEAQREFFENNGFERALRHCVILEARMTDFRISKTPENNPEENKKLRKRLKQLMSTYRLKRSDICPK